VLIFTSEVVLPGKDGLRWPDSRANTERAGGSATEWTDEIDSILDRGYVPLLKPYSVQRLEGVFTELLCKSPATACASGATVPAMSASTMASTTPERRQLRPPS
jgi:hypothetical protein